MLARKQWAYGQGIDYFDEARCIGFVRTGDPRLRAAGMAVVLNIATRHASKRMCVGKGNAGRKFVDLLGFAWGEVEIDRHGWGVFPVGPRSVGVWLDKQSFDLAEIDQLASKLST